MGKTLRRNRTRAKRGRRPTRGMYNMKGCSKKSCKNRTPKTKRTKRKHHLGGSYNIGTSLNLAYTGKGGNVPKVYPNVGPNVQQSGSVPYFLNSTQKAGNKKGGGSMSNFLGQDLLNLGRQMQFGVGSAYNSINGYSPQNNNPMPWKDQMVNSSNVINNIKNIQ